MMRRIVLAVAAFFFLAGYASAQTATVNWGTTHQTIDGFGAASIFDGGLTNLSSNLNLFFNPSTGNGYSILRVGIPDGSGGGIPGDCSTVNSGCAGDLTTMNAVLAINPAIRIFATSLSPPASMKTNSSTICSAGAGSGALLSGSYAAYATWLTNYVKSVAAQGITLYAISIQNEPNFCPTYDGALWSGANFDTFVTTNLGPSLAAAGITVKVMLPETSGSSALTTYANPTMTDGSAVGYVGLVATHDYDVSEVASPVTYTTGGKNFWETEVSDFNTFDPTITSGLVYAQEINNWMTQSNLNAWNFWWMVGLNGDNEGLIDNASSVVAKRTYTIGNYAKFIRPGYVRVDCTTIPASGVSFSCYKNPSTGAFAFVAINSNGSTSPLTVSLSGFSTSSVTPWVTSASLNLVQQSSISVSGSSFSATLAASSVTTFVGTQSGSPGCSGSGTSWSCGAGSSDTQVQTAINSASNNATITFAAGSYSWTNIVAVNPSVGVSLLCASLPPTSTVGSNNACQMSTTQQAQFGLANFSGTNTNFYRIAGFNFNEVTGNGGQMIWFGYDCTAPLCTGTLTQVRIDHNTFTLQNNAFAVTSGVSYSGGQWQGNIYGVMDHNLLQPRSDSTTSAGIFRPIGQANPSPPSLPLGTGNNMFIENNTLAFTALDGTGTPCLDAWGGAAIVIRYNTSNDCLWASHGASHGGGTINYEFYGNHASVDAGANGTYQGGYRLLHHQGSTVMTTFNNQFTTFGTPTGDSISLLYYRDYATGDSQAPTCSSAGDCMWPCDGTQMMDGNRSPTSSNYGYPCWYGLGRDAATGNYVPDYAWNNIYTNNGAQVPLSLDDGGGAVPPSCTAFNGSNSDVANCDYKTIHELYNREAWNAVSASAQTSPTSPFNGTATLNSASPVGGMGFGTLANRPTSGTASTENAFGHGAAGTGYFATDVGAQGTLYVWTGSWTTFYTPYTYPHPLVSGGSGAPGFSLTPPSFNFGNVPVGSSPGCPTQCQTFTVSNPGSATTIITSISNVGGQSSDFVIPGGSNQCVLVFAGSLAPGQSCTLVIQYLPFILGPESTTLTFSTNVTGTPQQGALTGTGVSPSPPTPSNAILSIR